MIMSIASVLSVQQDVIEYLRKIKYEVKIFLLIYF